MQLKQCEVLEKPLPAVMETNLFSWIEKVRQYYFSQHMTPAVMQAKISEANTEAVKLAVELDKISCSPDPLALLINNMKNAKLKDEH